MMRNPVITSPPGFSVLLESSDEPGKFEAWPVIGWELVKGVPPRPITINGAPPIPDHGLELPNGEVLDKDLPASPDREVWFERRMAFNEKKKFGSANFHSRDRGNSHDA